MGGLDFYFAGGGAGIFSDADGPRIPGRYSYMPYRSGSHSRMQTVVREGGQPRCSCSTEKDDVEFTVRACPENGVLEIVEIHRGPRKGP